MGRSAMSMLAACAVVAACGGRLNVDGPSSDASDASDATGVDAPELADADSSADAAEPGPLDAGLCDAPADACSACNPCPPVDNGTDDCNAGVCTIVCDPGYSPTDHNCYWYH